MDNILKSAQEQFREVQSLLTQPTANNDYFTQLSIATEEAYFVMNSGMCNTAECEHCMQHRDFIRSVMDVLGELEIDSAKAEKYTTILKEYAARVNLILERIAIFLS
jgi:hypothetical protein